MTLTPENIRDNLVKLISDMQNNSWKYTNNPTDYSRQRKISFSDAVLSTILMQKSASKAEILKYFDFSNNTPTASALIQQRKKITLEAFETLFHDFYQACPINQTLKGYDLVAVDGSDIYIPRNSKDTETFRITDKYKKGFNMMHLNAAYNLLNRLYADVILQPLNHVNEYKAMCDLIDNYSASFPKRKPVFLADRGYCAMNIFAHAIENNAYFLIRAKDADSPDPKTLLSTLELPDSPEFDIIYERWLTHQKKKTYKAEPEVYKYVTKGLFDYLDSKKKSIYYICFRIVRFKLPNGKSETVYTNLPREDFNTEELKSLYNRRWGIETSFRDIKYAAGMLFFHSRTKALILQEIYAKLILYNFCEAITGTIALEKKERKYIYRINFTIAIDICVEFLRRAQGNENIDVTTLIKRELIPERPGRSSPRHIRARTATTFLYR